VPFWSEVDPQGACLADASEMRKFSQSPRQLAFIVTADVTEVRVQRGTVLIAVTAVSSRASKQNEE
jgi:hypothetical protein